MAGRWQTGMRVFLVAAFVIVGAALPARAITILRDPDIEYALKQLALPMINAAGLNARDIEILVVKDSKLNAFVVDTQHVLIHSGLILKMKSAEELQAVIAHVLVILE